MRSLLPLLLAALLPGVALAAPGPGPEAAQAPEAKPRPEISLSNRLSVGAIVDLPYWGSPGFELLLSDRLRLGIESANGLTTSVLFAGRVGLRPAVGRVDRPRIREAGVRLETSQLRIELGRSAVIDGGWRLVDGVQALARPGKGVEVGGWIGEMPDLWTTAPAPRFGGGPILRFRGRRVQVGVVGELGGGASGVDRAAVRATGRFEWNKLLDVSARGELEAGGPGKPVRFSELGLSVRVTPVPILRLRTAYSMHAGHAWLQGIQRDPSLARWWQRTTGAEPLEPLPWDAATDGPTHQVLGSAEFTPPVGDAVLEVRASGRYSHRTVARERSARLALEGGLRDLFGGRLDVMAGGGALLWGGSWRGELGLRAWFGPDRKGILNLEAEARVWLQRKAETGVVSPSVAADAWVDVLLPVGVSLAVGYRFDNDLDLDRWNASHTVLARATWRLRLPGPRR